MEHAIIKESTNYSAKRVTTDYHYWDSAGLAHY